MIYDKPFVNAVTYELSLMQKRYVRQVYTLLDFLAELGGLLSFLRLLSIGLVIVFQFFGSHSNVMEETFWDRSDLGGRLPWVWKTETRYDRASDIQWNSTKSLLFTAHMLLPQCCLTGCLKPNRK